MSLLMRYFGMPYRAFPRAAERWLSREEPFLWSSEASFPRVNVHVDDEAVVMEFELPGVAREDIDLTTTDSSVTLKVRCPVEGDIPPEKYHVRERLRGEFGRTLSMPARVESSKATASHSRGILTLTIPKRTEARGRRIEIQSA